MFKPAAFFLFLVISIQISAQPAGSFKVTSFPGVQDLDIPGLSLLQIKYLEKLYYSSVTAPNELINGKEYLPYYWKSGTNPLLFVNRNRTSTLFFRDMEIKNLTLQYDTYLDEVIYTDNTRMVNGQLARIALNKYNIKGFNLYFDYDSMLFRYLRFPARYSDKMKDGYYEVVYDGRSQFLIKHRSTLYNKEGRDKYGYSPEKYIFSGDAWVKTGSKKSFMKIFGDRKKEMSELMHTSKIKIQRAGKAQIAELLRYYDSQDKPGK